MRTVRFLAGVAINPTERGGVIRSPPSEGESSKHDDLPERTCNVVLVLSLTETIKKSSIESA